MSNIQVYLRIKPHIEEPPRQYMNQETDDNTVNENIENEEKLNLNEEKKVREKLQIKIKKTENNSKLYLNSKTHRTKIFTFDEIFEDDVQQPQVYSSIKNDLISSTMNGFNYCLMAYGQTSAGKTYTLLGDMKEKANWGILPRFLVDLFDQEKVEERFHDLEVKCSFFEIYNEQLYDLLNEDRGTLSLREDPKKGIFVENLQEEKVLSLEETLKFFEIGMSHRTTAETRLNQRSSRSHGIFTIKVEHTLKGEEDQFTPMELLNKKSKKNKGKKKKNLKLKKRSVVHFLDLAGSERQMVYDKDRLKESCQINNSLVVLSNVITSLTKESSKNKRFLHFRDSKLTLYLRDVLGGNSKTTIITNILNDEKYYFETFNTLRFSATAKTIKISPKANFVAEGSEDELQAEIRFLLQKVEKLEKQHRGVSNKSVLRMVHRMKNAWNVVSQNVKDNDLMAKESLVTNEKIIRGVLNEIEILATKAGIEYLFETHYNEILEEIEIFFEENKIMDYRKFVKHFNNFGHKIKSRIYSIKSGRFSSEGRDKVQSESKMVKSSRPNFFSPRDSSLSYGVGGKSSKSIPKTPAYSPFRGQRRSLKFSSPVEHENKFVVQNKRFEEKVHEINEINSQMIKDYSRNVEKVKNENIELKIALLKKNETIEELRSKLGIKTPQITFGIKKTPVKSQFSQSRKMSLEEGLESIKESVSTGEIPKEELENHLNSSSFKKSKTYSQAELIKNLQDDLFSMKEKIKDLENLCSSKDELIMGLKRRGLAPLTNYDNSESGLKEVLSMRESLVEEDISKLSTIERKYIDARQEINFLREELLNSQRGPKRKKSGMRVKKKRRRGKTSSRKKSKKKDFKSSYNDIKVNGYDSEIFKNNNRSSVNSSRVDYARSTNSLRKTKMSNNSTENKKAFSTRNLFMKNYLHPRNRKNGKTNLNSDPYLTRDITNEFSIDKAARTMVENIKKAEISSKIREDLIDNSKFKDKIKDLQGDKDDMEFIIREKNREIIFYLKEIDKLQNENEGLRGKWKNNGKLKAYKLKLQNRKLRQELKKFIKRKNHIAVLGNN